MILDVNWPAVLVSAVATFVLGGVWYGPLFGRALRAAEGQVEPQPGRQKHPAIVYGLSFVLMLIAAAALAIAVGPDPTVQSDRRGPDRWPGLGRDVVRSELSFRGPALGAVRGRCRLQRRVVRADGIDHRLVWFG